MEAFIAIGALGLVGLVWYAVNSYEPPAIQETDPNEAMHVDTGLLHDTLRTTTGVDSAYTGINKGYSAPPIVLRGGADARLLAKIREIQGMESAMAAREWRKVQEELGDYALQIPANDRSQRFAIMTVHNGPLIQLSQQKRKEGEAAPLDHARARELIRKMAPPPFLQNKKINIF